MIQHLRKAEVEVVQSAKMTMNAALVVGNVAVKVCAQRKAVASEAKQSKQSVTS
jgi:hypothetical protein